MEFGTDELVDDLNTAKLADEKDPAGLLCIFKTGERREVELGRSRIRNGGGGEEIEGKGDTKGSRSHSIISDPYYNNSS